MHIIQSFKLAVDCSNFLNIHERKKLKCSSNIISLKMQKYRLDKIIFFCQKYAFLHLLNPRKNCTVRFLSRESPQQQVGQTFFPHIFIFMQYINYNYNIKNFESANITVKMRIIYNSEKKASVKYQVQLPVGTISDTSYKYRNSKIRKNNPLRILFND